MHDQLEISKSAGNVRYLGAPSEAAARMKAMLASRIASALDAGKLSVRTAEEATGFAAADFSRIRQGKLDRFTVDRLMAILGKVDPGIELSVFMRPKITRDWILAKLKAHETDLRARGVTALYLFGSSARDEAGPESDVDLFIEHDPKNFRFLELVGIKVDLEEELGVPFHVSTRDSLRLKLKNRIEREAIRVF